jgi:hypothetical protein
MAQLESQPCRRPDQIGFRRGVGRCDHEGSDDTWGVELTGITRRFQIVEDLFVYGAEMLAVG